MTPLAPHSDAEPAQRVKWPGLFLGLFAFGVLALVPSGLHRIEGFGHRPAYAAGVALLMAIWWFTEALPMAWTACAPLVLFPVLDVFGKGLPGSAVRSALPYVDPYIFLFLGGMALGVGMEQWGLHRRLALHVMHAIGTAPQRLLLGVLVATAAVSMWISNTATAVMMMPIAMALLAQLEAERGGVKLMHYGTALMLAVAYGANVGGIGTKIGTAANSLLAGYLSEKLQYELGFVEYMAVGLPFVALFIPLAWAVLWRVGRRDQVASTSGREVLARQLRELGPMSRGERAVAAVFLGAAALWILGGPLKQALSPLAQQVLGLKLQGKHVEAAVAMGAAAVLLATRVLAPRSLARVPWGTLVLLGGSFAMAEGIDGSGLASWLAGHLAELAHLPLLLQLALTSVATVVLTAVASNTATTTVLLNLLPRSPVVLATCAIASSCDFALPAGTPPNAIVFGSGYIRLPTMMRIGLSLDLAAMALVTLYAYLYLPLVLR